MSFWVSRKKPMPFNPDEALRHLRSVSKSFLPRNAVSFSSSVVSKKLSTNALGCTAEHDPFTGSVVDVQDRFSIVQTATNHFVVIEASVLRKPLVVGNRVSITPYARRRFDGTLVKSPFSQQRSKGGIHTTVGASVSRIPVERPKTGLGRHLLSTIERLRCPDGVRVLSNFLVDLGASNFVFLEPGSEDSASTNDLQLIFDCSASSFTGRVTIGMATECELFYLLMHRVPVDAPEQLVHSCESIALDSVAEVITTLLCDGQWQFAQVEVLETITEGVPA